jgi:hypothetical protein
MFKKFQSLEQGFDLQNEENSTMEVAAPCSLNSIKSVTMIV